jgi:multiple sugar transport system permease protein
MRLSKSNVWSSEARWGYLMVSPYILGMIVFVIGPVIAAVFISFTQYSILAPPKWIGLANYKELMSDDTYWQAFRNTLYFTALFVPFQTIVALILASALKRAIRGISWIRTSFFIPVVSSWVAVSLLWYWIYNPKFGLFNYLLRSMGLPALGWLSDEKLVIPCLVLVAVWKGAGYMMVILLAGLKNIPEQLYEAAVIDSANKWQQFRHVTLPLLSPTLFLVIIITMLWSVNAFDQVYVMTQGGPNKASMVLGLYLYNNAFVWYRMGYASVIAWSMFAILLVISGIQFATQKRWVHYN